MFGGNKDGWEKVAQTEAFKQLMQHPKFQELLQDDSLRKAAETKNIFKLMSNSKFLSVMRDNELRGILMQLKSTATDQ